VTIVDTTMPDAAPAAPADSVTESADAGPVTLADVIAAMAAADGTLAAIADAVTRDASAFILSALTTADALTNGGITAKAIAAAAKAAGIVGITSTSAVARHGRTGEILSLGGDLAEGFNPRAIQACYDKSTKVGGVRVVISVTPRQHDAVMRDAVDVMTAYRLLVKCNRDNLAAKRALSTAETETDDGETDDGETETGPVSVTETLRAALASLTAVIGADMTAEDFGLLAEISDVVTMLADDGETETDTAEIAA